MEIEKLKVQELIEYEFNAKEHPEAQVEQIVESIKEFGFNDPIAIDENNVIIEGHGRLYALKKLGVDEVECIRLSHLNEEQKKAYILAHNKLTMNTGFDVGTLTLELDKITTLDMSKFGFTLDAPIPDIQDDDFEIVEPDEPVSKLGQIYKLGNHRLMCGDSTKQQDVEKLMDGVKADFVFTDPPWNVDYGAQQNHPSWKPRSIMNDSMTTDDFKDFMVESFQRMNESSKPGCMTYVVMSAQEWGNMMLALDMNDYHWSSTIIWNKDRLVLSRKDYHTKYEPIWYGWKNGEARLHPLADRKQCDVWDFERPSRSDEHPTMKPLALVAQAMGNSSNKGDVVLDLFGGSGTTLIVAEELERSCHMMELDPKYVDVIINRWETITGKKAELEC